MNWLKNAMTLAVVALWVLASNHCRLEQLPFLEVLACGDQEEAAPHHDSDCETDCCALVESSFYKTEDTLVKAVVPPLLPAFQFVALLPANVPGTVASLDFLTLAPPELPVTWHFSARAALPPRAPSFAS